MEAVNGGSLGEGGPPPPSPLTGCYLLVVVGEPHSQDHKDIILQKVAKGLLSWDVNECLVDLGKELAVITDQNLEGEEARFGERLIQFASENLVTEILIHPAVSTLQQCVRNLLSSFTRHRHIIHAGYTFQGNGSWALQDGTFSYSDFAEAFQEIEVQRVIHAYENGISIDLHCAPEGDWTRLPKESFAKACKVRVNPTDVLTTGSPSISSFTKYLEPFLVPTVLEDILESSDVVGNIRFSRPTLYVFPGGQGDAALFGINGFNMLLDGGYSRKACFWDFVRHLDRLDAVLMTRLNNSSVSGVSSVLKRKRQGAVYPQIGHFFCNIQERKSPPSPDGDKDKDPLIVNLLEEGQSVIQDLKQLHLNPQTCYRDIDPIILYHKVGHGTLNMFVLSPDRNSKEVREFLQKWNQSDPKLFAATKGGKEFTFPLQNLVSICALLVWQPANPNDTITRILYPGSTPQKKIFEGFDRLKSVEYLKQPTCTVKSFVTVKKAKQEVIEKLTKTPIITEKKTENKILSDEPKKEMNGDAIRVKEEKPEETKKIDEVPKENGEKAKPKMKPKVKEEKKKVPEKRGPPTPKKSLENRKNADTKEKDRKSLTKASPEATPAKSAKDATNRKVVESKRAPQKKEPTPKTAPKKDDDVKQPKPERKPISRRPKTVKGPPSPLKKMTNGTQKPDTLFKRGKLDKEGTTDSSTVSTPSADQDSILKKDISKMTPEEIQQLKEQELEELKEEQEVNKEIEAVFRRSEAQEVESESGGVREVKETSIDDNLEAEEYLIVEKEEIEHDSLDQEAKEDEMQKLVRDSEESEKQRKLSSDEEKKIKGEEDIKEVVESQPDEKVESGATTTAPTLPEDERITLDEIKEDKPPIEEKHVKEETKEKELPVIQLPPKLEPEAAKQPLPLDKQKHVKDIVKTPDEVADLPVHEEADYQGEFQAEDKKVTNELTPRKTDEVLEKADTETKEKPDQDNNLKETVEDEWVVVTKEEEAIPPKPKIELDLTPTHLDDSKIKIEDKESDSEADEHETRKEDEIQEPLEKDTEDIKALIEEADKKVSDIEKITAIKETKKDIADLDVKLQELKKKIPDIKENLKDVAKYNDKLAELKSTSEEELDQLPPVLKDLDIDKAELGRKSPAEREEDVKKIVASVAEVLKSDAPLEELTKPFSFTQELRETHITTQDSPISDVKIIKTDDIPPIPEEPAEDDLKKEKTTLETEGEKDDDTTVHRMLVTASSEDGGEEIEICPPGTITFSRSSESSGRSSPEPSVKSHKSSVTESVLTEKQVDAAKIEDSKTKAITPEKRSSIIASDFKPSVDAEESSKVTAKQATEETEGFIEKSDKLVDSVVTSISEAAKTVVHEPEALKEEPLQKSSIVDSVKEAADKETKKSVDELTDSKSSTVKDIEEDALRAAPEEAKKDADVKDHIEPTAKTEKGAHIEGEEAKKEKRQEEKKPLKEVKVQDIKPEDHSANAVLPEEKEDHVEQKSSTKEDILVSSGKEGEQAKKEESQEEKTPLDEMKIQDVKPEDHIEPTAKAILPEEKGAHIEGEEAIKEKRQEEKKLLEEVKVQDIKPEDHSAKAVLPEEKGDQVEQESSSKEDILVSSGKEVEEAKKEERQEDKKSLEEVKIQDIKPEDHIEPTAKAVLPAEKEEHIEQKSSSKEDISVSSGKEVEEAEKEERQEDKKSLEEVKIQDVKPEDHIEPTAKAVLPAEKEEHIEQKSSSEDDIFVSSGKEAEEAKKEERQEDNKSLEELKIQDIKPEDHIEATTKAVLPEEKADQIELKSNSKEDILVSSGKEAEEFKKEERPEDKKSLEEVKIQDIKPEDTKKVLAEVPAKEGLESITDKALQHKEEVKTQEIKPQEEQKVTEPAEKLDEKPVKEDQKSLIQETKSQEIRDDKVADKILEPKFSTIESIDEKKEESEVKIQDTKALEVKEKDQKEVAKEEPKSTDLPSEEVKGIEDKVDKDPEQKTDEMKIEDIKTNEVVEKDQKESAKEEPKSGSDEKTLPEEKSSEEVKIEAIKTPEVVDKTVVTEEKGKASEEGKIADVKSVEVAEKDGLETPKQKIEDIKTSEVVSTKEEQKAIGEKTLAGDKDDSSDVVKIEDIKPTEVIEKELPQDKGKASEELKTIEVVDKDQKESAKDEKSTSETMLPEDKSKSSEEVKIEGIKKSEDVEEDQKESAKEEQKSIGAKISAEGKDDSSGEVKVEDIRATEVVEKDQKEEQKPTGETILAEDRSKAPEEGKIEVIKTVEVEEKDQKEPVKEQEKTLTEDKGKASKEVKIEGIKTVDIQEKGEKEPSKEEQISTDKKMSLEDTEKSLEEREIVDIETVEVKEKEPAKEEQKSISEKTLPEDEGKAPEKVQIEDIKTVGVEEKDQKEPTKEEDKNKSTEEVNIEDIRASEVVEKDDKESAKEEQKSTGPKLLLEDKEKSSEEVKIEVTKTTELSQKDLETTKEQKSTSEKTLVDDKEKSSDDVEKKDQKESAKEDQKPTDQKLLAEEKGKTSDEVKNEDIKTVEVADKDHTESEKEESKPTSEKTLQDDKAKSSEELKIQEIKTTEILDHEIPAKEEQQFPPEKTLTEDKDKSSEETKVQDITTQQAIEDLKTEPVKEQILTAKEEKPQEATKDGKATDRIPEVEKSTAEQPSRVTEAFAEKPVKEEKSSEAEEVKSVEAIDDLKSTAKVLEEQKSEVTASVGEKAKPEELKLQEDTEDLKASDSLLDEAEKPVPKEERKSSITHPTEGKEKEEPKIQKATEKVLEEADKEVVKKEQQSSVSASQKELREDTADDRKEDKPIASAISEEEKKIQQDKPQTDLEVLKTVEKSADDAKQVRKSSIIEATEEFLVKAEKGLETAISSVGESIKVFLHEESKASSEAVTTKAEDKILPKEEEKIVKPQEEIQQEGVQVKIDKNVEETAKPEEKPGLVEAAEELLVKTEKDVESTISSVSETIKEVLNDLPEETKEKPKFEAVTELKSSEEKESLAEEKTPKEEVKLQEIEEKPEEKSGRIEATCCIDFTVKSEEQLEAAISSVSEALKDALHDYLPDEKSPLEDRKDVDTVLERVDIEKPLTKGEEHKEETISQEEQKDSPKPEKPERKSSIIEAAKDLLVKSEERLETAISSVGESVKDFAHKLLPEEADLKQDQKDTATVEKKPEVTEAKVVEPIGKEEKKLQEETKQEAVDIKDQKELTGKSSVIEAAEELLVKTEKTLETAISSVDEVVKDGLHHLVSEEKVEGRDEKAELKDNKGINILDQEKEQPESSETKPEGSNATLTKVQEDKPREDSKVPERKSSIIEATEEFLVKSEKSLETAISSVGAAVKDVLFGDAKPSEVKEETKEQEPTEASKDVCKEPKVETVTKSEEVDKSSLIEAAEEFLEKSEEKLESVLSSIGDAAKSVFQEDDVKIEEKPSIETKSLKSELDALGESANKLESKEEDKAKGESAKKIEESEKKLESVIECESAKKPTDESKETAQPSPKKEIEEEPTKVERRSSVIEATEEFIEKSEHTLGSMFSAIGEAAKGVLHGLMPGDGKKPAEADSKLETKVASGEVAKSDLHEEEKNVVKIEEVSKDAKTEDKIEEGTAKVDDSAEEVLKAVTEDLLDSKPFKVTEEHLANKELDFKLDKKTLKKEEHRLEEQAEMLEKKYDDLCKLEKHVSFDKCNVDEYKYDKEALKKEERQMEDEANELSRSYEDLSKLTESVHFDKCPSPDECKIDKEMLKKEERQLEDEAKELRRSYEDLSTLTESVKFAKCSPPAEYKFDKDLLKKEKRQIEDEADVLRRSYEDLSTLTESVHFDTCPPPDQFHVDAGVLKKEERQIEDQVTELERDYEDLTKLSKEVHFAKCHSLQEPDKDRKVGDVGDALRRSREDLTDLGDETDNWKRDGKKEDGETTKLTVDVGDAKKLSISDVEISLKTEPEKEKASDSFDAKVPSSGLPTSSSLSIPTSGSGSPNKPQEEPTSPSLKHDSGLSEQTETDEEDLSTKSQVAHSQSDLEEMDPMSTSFYGAFPKEFEEAPPTYLYEITKAKYSTDVKVDDKVAHKEDVEVATASFTPKSSSSDLDDWGKPLGLPAPAPSHLYEVTKAKYGTGSSEEMDVMTCSFIGDQLPTAPSGPRGEDPMTTSVYFEEGTDPIASWGKPLGLPSPAPPNNNGTPKKEKKLSSYVTAKNKLNDDKKRAESPSKRGKKTSPVYVDLAYVPHHGNHYYSFVDFFKRVRARYYVFSGLEPSRQVYDALLEAKTTWDDKDLEVTIIPTYDTDILGYWVAENEDQLGKLKIDLAPSASRCTINLQDHETSCSAYRLEF